MLKLERTSDGEQTIIRLIGRAQAVEVQWPSSLLTDLDFAGGLRTRTSDYGLMARAWCISSFRFEAH